MHSPDSRRKYLVEVHAYAGPLYTLVMKESSPKLSKKYDARQAEREARKAFNNRIKPEEVERVIVLESGEELMVMKPVSIPGYTYSF